jgi:hypothetical protein
VFWGKPFVRGLIPRADGIVLRQRNMWVRNSFQTYADVRLRPGGHGTQVEITLRSQYFVAAFMTFWLAVVSLFTIVGFGAVLIGTTEPSALLGIGLFLLFGFGFVAFGRLLARPGREPLIEFIARVTEGQRYPDSVLPPM